MHPARRRRVASALHGRQRFGLGVVTVAAVTQGFPQPCVAMSWRPAYSRPAGGLFGKRAAKQHLARLAASRACMRAQVFLRHLFILRYRLPFPSATATAVMINGLHTASGSANGIRQVTPPPFRPQPARPTTPGLSHAVWHSLC